MPVLTQEFANALIRAVLPTALPSAVEDLAHRFVADQPPDIARYVATLQTDYPSYFAPSAAPAHQATTPAPDLSFLSAAERLSRSRPAAPAKRDAPRPLAPAVAAALGEMAPTARLTAYRRLQAGQA